MTITQKPTGQLLLLRHAGHLYALRYDPAHPLAAYFTLEDWHRERIMPSTVFGYAICQVCQAATEARKDAV